MGNRYSSFSGGPNLSSDESDGDSDDDDESSALDAFEDSFQFGERLDSVIEDLCD